MHLDVRTVQMIMTVFWIILSYPAYCWVRREGPFK